VIEEGELVLSSDGDEVLRFAAATVNVPTA
jgi:hypothetical protein